MFLCSFLPLGSTSVSLEGKGQDSNVISSTSLAQKQSGLPHPRPPPDSRSQPIAGKVNLLDMESNIVCLSHGIKRGSGSDPREVVVVRETWQGTEIRLCRQRPVSVTLQPPKDRSGVLLVETTLPAAQVPPGPQLGGLERKRESASTDCGGGGPACALDSGPPIRHIKVVGANLQGPREKQCPDEAEKHGWCK